jgi:hypothetical protein
MFVFVAHNEVATVENEDPATQYRYKRQIKDLIPIAFIERVDERVRGIRKEQNKFSFVQILRESSCVRVKILTLTGFNKGSENAFLLKFEEGVMFFIASSLDEKQQWVNDIKNVRQHVSEVDILLVTNS